MLTKASIRKISFTNRLSLVRNGKFPATTCTTCCKNTTAIGSTHALTETVFILSATFRWLVCPFHGIKRIWASKIRMAKVYYFFFCTNNAKKKGLKLIYSLLDTYIHNLLGFKEFFLKIGV